MLNISFPDETIVYLLIHIPVQTAFVLAGGINIGERVIGGKNFEDNNSLFPNDCFFS